MREQNIHCTLVSISDYVKDRLKLSFKQVLIEYTGQQNNVKLNISTRQENSAIAGRTAQCRCKFRHVGLSDFTTAS